MLYNIPKTTTRSANDSKAMKTVGYTKKKRFSMTDKSTNTMCVWCKSEIVQVSTESNFYEKSNAFAVLSIYYNCIDRHNQTIKPQFSKSKHDITAQLSCNIISRGESFLCLNTAFSAGFLCREYVVPTASYITVDNSQCMACRRLPDGSNP